MLTEITIATVIVFAVLIELKWRPRLDLTENRNLLLWYGTKGRHVMVIW